MAWQLCQSQTAVGIWPKSLGVVFNRSRRRLANGPFVLRRRRPMGDEYLQRLGGKTRMLGLRLLSQSIGETSLDTLRGIRLDRNVPDSCLEYFVLAQVEACKRNRPFRNPSRCLQCSGILR